MASAVVVLLRAYYCTITVAALASTRLDFLRHWARFGKLRRDRLLATPSGFARALDIVVPKAWFVHFYVVGAIATSAVIALATLFTTPALLQLRVGGGDLGGLRCSADGVSLTMLCVVLAHVLRRLCEEVWVLVHGTAGMHVLAYVTGISYYLCLPVAVISECPSGAESWSGKLRVCIAVAGFFLASWCQHMSHRALAAHRHPARRSVYVIPHGFGFQRLSCPHYLAEIGIYLCLVVGVWPRSWSVLCWLATWVVVSHCLNAVRTHSWYRRQFGTSYPSERRALVPFML